MREECIHFQSRTYASGEAARFCVLDLAPEAPWRCPADCPKYERKMIDAGWQYGSMVPPKTPVEPTSEAAHDPDVAALLDEAESIVNDIGFQLLAEEERKAKRKLFRKANKKRKR